MRSFSNYLIIKETMTRYFISDQFIDDLRSADLILEGLGRKATSLDTDLLGQYHADKISEKGQKSWQSEINKVQNKVNAAKMKVDQAKDEKAKARAEKSLAKAQEELKKIKSNPQKDPSFFSKSSGASSLFFDPIKSMVGIRAPIGKAIEDLSRETGRRPSTITNDEIKDYVQNTLGEKLISSENVKKHIAINMMQDIAMKARVGRALNPKESKIYEQWKAVTQEVGSIPTSILSPSTMEKIRQSRDKTNPTGLTPPEQAEFNQFKKGLMSQPFHDKNSFLAALAQNVKTYSDESNLPPEVKMSPHVAYQEMKKRGFEVVSDEEAADYLIDTTRVQWKKGAVYTGVQSGGANDPLPPEQQGKVFTNPQARSAVDRYFGDEDTLARKGLTEPENQPGLQQWGSGEVKPSLYKPGQKSGSLRKLDPNADPKPIAVPNTPKPSIGSRRWGPSDEVNKFYESNPQAYADEVVKVACRATTTLLASRMREDGIRLSIPFDELKGDDTYCGLADSKDEEVQRSLKAIGDYLGETDLGQIVDEVSKKMLRATAYPEWRESEGLRYSYAMGVAKNILSPLLKGRGKERTNQGDAEGGRSNDFAIVGSAEGDVDIADYNKKLMQIDDIGELENMLMDLDDEDIDEREAIFNRIRDLEGFEDKIDSTDNQDDLIQMARKYYDREDEDAVRAIFNKLDSQGKRQLQAALA